MTGGMKLGLFGVLAMVVGFGITFIDRAVGLAVMAVAWIVAAYGWLQYRRATGKESKNKR